MNVFFCCRRFANHLCQVEHLDRRAQENDGLRSYIEREEGGESIRGLLHEHRKLQWERRQTKSSPLRRLQMHV